MIMQIFCIAKDVIEIIFFTSIIYVFCLWLKKDKSHNLLFYFFGYCIIFCFSALLNLSTIVTFLIYSAPIALIIFIIFHQELLQRNFITLTHMPITSLETFDWPEHLIRASLHAINNNKQLICVIENQADLKPFLYTPIPCNTVLLQNLITILIDSTGFDQKKILWCNTQGKLVGINGEWQITAHETWQTQSVNDLPTWKQDALLMTLKTDTIIYKADPTKRAFDVVIKGTVYENLAAHQTLLLLKKHLAISSSQKGETNHDRITQKHNSEQLNH
jgi:hypothetical protein